MAFGIDDVLAAGMTLLNKFIPDPAERAKAELEMFRMKRDGDFKELEAKITEMQEITKRAQADAASDSWLAKNIRPLVMIYLLVLVTLIGFDLIKPAQGFIEMIRSFTEYGLMFYFGGRSLEKVATTISEKFGRK